MFKSSSPRGFRVLVAGGAGSIGSELVRQLSKHNTLNVFDQNETAMFDLVEELKLKGFDVSGQVGDIRDRDVVWSAFRDFKPDYVYQVAAYKHVTPLEATPMEAVKTNIIGTWNVLDCAQEFKTPKLVFVSTDKASTANCVMGATKRVAELMVRNAGYTVVRFGNVLGSRGSVIPIWQHQIDSGADLTVTDPNMRRFMMSIQEAVELIIGATKESKGGDTWILDMGEQVNILELAKDILKKANSKVGIKMIGARPGEVLEERLMNEDEARRAVKKGKYYVI